MKTIEHKKTATNETPKKEVKKYLIEDPYGHHFLGSDSLTKRVSILTDLIQLKDSKYTKNKSSTLLTSSIGLCLSLLLVIGMFEWEFKADGSAVDLATKADRFDDLLEIPPTQQIQKPPAKLQAPVIIEVSDEEIIEEIEIDLDIEMTEQTRIEEVITSQPEEAMPEEKADEIFVIVEIQPSPEGGMRAFYDYVAKNLKYPSQARRMGIEGRVFVEFVVEKDGTLTDIKAVKGIGAGCNEEAIRVISEAPKWNPGKQRGRNVRVRMVLPIVFKLM